MANKPEGNDETVEQPEASGKVIAEKSKKSVKANSKRRKRVKPLSCNTLKQNFPNRFNSRS
jgi:hypothetical protein